VILRFLTLYVLKMYVLKMYVLKMYVCMYEMGLNDNNNK